MTIVQGRELFDDCGFCVGCGAGAGVSAAGFTAGFAEVFIVCFCPPKREPLDVTLERVAALLASATR